MYCRGHGLSRPETGRDRRESRPTRGRCKACFVPIKGLPSKDGGGLLSIHVSAPLRPPFSTTCNVGDVRSAGSAAAAMRRSERGGAWLDALAWASSSRAA